MVKRDGTSEELELDTLSHVFVESFDFGNSFPSLPDKLGGSAAVYFFNKKKKSFHNESF
ncbi:MAG TPA: hypothetical protein VJH94_01075 [Candidatus Paceibacterota bacterium]